MKERLENIQGAKYLIASIIKKQLSDLEVNVIYKCLNTIQNNLTAIEELQEKDKEKMSSELVWVLNLASKQIDRMNQDEVNKFIRTYDFLTKE